MKFCEAIDKTTVDIFVLIKCENFKFNDGVLNINIKIKTSSFKGTF